MADSEFASKVLRQVEHYFGDANMRRDKWLKEEVAKHQEGYVLLEKVCSFNKMKELGATDVAKVAEILKDSEVVALNDDLTMLRRKNPLPETDDSQTRTIYAKGFPTTMTIEELQKFWDQHGKVALVQMRRIGKNFKGSVLVEMKTKDEADAIIAKKAEIKLGETALEITTFEEWNKEKHTVSQQRKEESQAKKRKAEEDKKQQKETERAEFITSLETKEVPQGLVIKIQGVPDGVKRELLAEHLKPFGDIRFVDYRLGQEAAFVRFDKPIEENLEKIKEAKLGEATLTVELLTGDDLKQYWVKLWTMQFDKQHAADPRQSHRGGHHHHAKRRRT